VERFAFDAAAFVPQQEALERVTVAPLTKAGPVQAAVFRIAPGGCIGRHPTTVPQILAVLEGSGEVSGAEACASRSEPAKPSTGPRVTSTRPGLTSD
jgi:hypothetical protein